MPTSGPAGAARSALLEVRDLCVHYRFGGGWARVGRRVVRAVDGVTFTVPAGGALGLVGESGCGKSTLARAVVRLTPPTSGTVRFEGRDVASLHGAGLRRFRRGVQMIFQDPDGSLNPRQRVETLVGEALAVHGLARDRRQRREQVATALGRVGLGPDALDRYPHEFSGGQRQRIGIARALALSPRLIVCDEPVSALDVSVQAQVLNLLADLRAALGLAYLFIAHNLAVVRTLCDDVAVMYLGRVVEFGPCERVLRQPRHPYTRMLLASVIEPGRAPAARRSPEADPPSAIDPPPGCAFHPRCPVAVPRCAAERPVLRVPLGAGNGHEAACHLADDPGPVSGTAQLTVRGAAC